MGQLTDGSRGSWDKNVTHCQLWDKMYYQVSDYSRELVQFFNFQFSSNDDNNNSSNNNNNNRSNIRFVASVAKQDDVLAVASPAKVVNRFVEMNR